MDKLRQFKSFLDDRLTLWFFITAACLGLLFVFIIPPFCGFDEGTHIYRVYQLSTGDVVGDKLPAGGTGGYIAQSLVNDVQNYRNNFIYKENKISKHQFHLDLHQPLQDNQRAPTRFENTVLYSPVAYAPQVIVMWILRHLNVSPLILLYGCRLTALAVWLVLTTLSVRLLRTKRLFVSALLLIPMSLFAAASVSIDGQTVALSVLLVALISRFYVLQKVPKTELIIFMLAWLALALTKLPYFLFGFLIFLIPRKNLPGNKRWLPIASGALLTVLLAAIWYWLSNTTFNSYRYDAVVNPSFQEKSLFTDPFKFILSMGWTFLSGYGNDFVNEFYGIFVDNTFRLPSWIPYMWTSLLVLLALYKEAGEVALARLVRIGGLALAAVVFIGINVLLYVSWTLPTTKHFIEGLQGRYYIPVVLMLAIPLSGVGIVAVSRRAIRRYSFAFMWAMLAVSIVCLAQYNYNLVR